MEQDYRLTATFYLTQSLTRVNLARYRYFNPVKRQKTLEMKIKDAFTYKNLLVKLNKRQDSSNAL